MLAGEGKIDFDQKVTDFVPEFGTNGKDVITIRQLLTHTSGFPYAPLSPTDAADRENRLAKFSKWRLNWDPGTKFEYHPTSAHWVLGEIVERVSDIPFQTFVEDRIMKPLGLTRFQLGVPIDQQGDVNKLVTTGEYPTPDEIEAATGFRLDVRDLLGEVTDEALHQLCSPEGLAVGFPGAGGIATAADIALYYQAVLNDPLGFWPAEHLAWASEVQVDFPDPMLGTPAHRSLGLQVCGEPPDAQRRSFAHGLSPRSFGHDGAAGQVAWVDPESGISFAYLTNGHDRHLLREARRKIGVGSRAAACAT
jgi:CubicO group peptidase (beta-lactamase class C family)